METSYVYHCISGVDECSENSTLCNSGQCTDRIGGYICSCPVGLGGSHCDKSRQSLYSNFIDLALLSTANGFKYVEGNV